MKTLGKKLINVENKHLHCNFAYESSAVSKLKCYNSFIFYPIGPRRYLKSDSLLILLRRPEWVAEDIIGDFCHQSLGPISQMSIWAEKF
jgi:hypothetical protein